MAFNEAIDKFDGRGSFLSFAKLVIKSRLYDYFRYLNRRGESESLYGDDGRETSGVIDKSFDNELKNSQRLELCSEIETFKKELSKYSISLEDLAKASPKHGKKRNAVNDVISYIIGNPKCLNFFEASGNIPLKIVESDLEISRKLIEPYRKYIIASILIQRGNYSYLKEYIK
jgi:RNA polymerase sigma factor